jgi:hypothetical protein
MPNDTTKEKVKILNKLIDLMSKDNDLPRDLQITFQEIYQYITRNE